MKNLAFTCLVILGLLLVKDVLKIDGQSLIISMLATLMLNNEEN